MAKSTRQHVFEGMELLPAALAPFVEKRLESSLTGHWQVQVLERYKGLKPDKNGQVDWDQQSLLKVMNIFWMEAFKDVLGQTERAIVNELIAVRNELAHDGKFTYDDAERALDSMRRLPAQLPCKLAPGGSDFPPAFQANNILGTPRRSDQHRPVDLIRHRQAVVRQELIQSRQITNLGPAHHVVKRQHGVGLTPAEVGLQLDNRIAA